MMTAQIIAQKLKTFLGNQVYKILIPEENEKPDWFGADIVVMPNPCPLVYNKKYGWTECEKCLLNYDCGHGSLQFSKFCDDNKIKFDWLGNGNGGIYLQVLPKKRTPITLYHKGKPVKAVLVEECDEVIMNEDEDEGFCNTCRCWEPIYKFDVDDKFCQPCKGCYYE